MLADIESNVSVCGCNNRVKIYLLLACCASRSTSIERLGVRMRVMASSTAVRTAEEILVKEPNFLPTKVLATDSQSLQAACIAECTHQAK